MQSRPVGSLGRVVSEFGLGTWQFGETEWGDVLGQQMLGTLAADLPSLGRALQQRLVQFYDDEAEPLI